MSKKTIVSGYGISIIVFVLSLITLNTTTQGSAMWLVLMMMSFILGALTSACVPINTKNTRQFIAGLMVLVLGSIAALDMYDEMRHSYGGFEAGNDFLFDGLSGLVYIYIIPVLFSVAQVLFIINSRKKIAVK